MMDENQEVFDILAASCLSAAAGYTFMHGWGGWGGAFAGLAILSFIDYFKGGD